MTQEMERTGVPAPPRDTADNRKSETRAPWMIPMTLLVCAFLVYQLPPYAAMDPTRSHIPLKTPYHYWLIVAHVMFGTVWLIAGLLQVWPWLRIRKPAVHRWTGRAYVFLGAVPSATLAILLLPLAYPSGKVGVAMAASLSAVTAVLGWVKLRQRRYAAHRQLMIYSFAIMWGQIIWGFMIGMPFAWGWVGGPDTNFNTVVEAAHWAGWVANLVALHWWMNRTAGRHINGLRGVRA